jgi:RNA polymerase sigma-70 factor (ECF subfamily)
MRLGRFMAAWDASTCTDGSYLLARDAMMAMPPEPFVRGALQVGAFFATVPPGGRLTRSAVPTSANRQPALAAYVPTPDGAASMRTAHGLALRRYRPASSAATRRTSSASLPSRPVG